MSTSVWDHVGYVKASQYREAVIDVLHGDESATPTEIAAATPYEITHISRALGRLRERGVVELLVSEDTHKGRIHGLTETGDEVAERLQERDSR